MERLSSRDADEVLAGRPPEGAAAASAASAVDRLRRELMAAPSAEVAERHLAAMRAGMEGGRSRMRRAKRQLATLGLAASLVLGAGLAGALTVPEQAADEAKERVADLPVPGPTGSPDEGDEGSAHDAASHGTAVSEAAQDDSTEGCEKGKAVSEIASSKANEHRRDDAERPDPCSAGDDETDEADETSGGQGGGGSAKGSGGGSGGQGGGSGSGGSTQGSGGGSGGQGGGSGSGGSTQGSGGGSGGQGGGSGSGAPSGTPAGPPEDVPTPGE